MQKHHSKLVNMNQEDRRLGRLSVPSSMHIDVRSIEAHPTSAIIPEICRDFVRSLCQRGARCHRIHPLDIRQWADKMSTGSGSVCNKSLKTGSLSTISSRNLHPRPPKYPELCRNWLRGFCQRGYQCSYVHEDLDYDEDDGHQFTSARSEPAQKVSVSCVSSVSSHHSSKVSDSHHSRRSLSTPAQGSWITVRDHITLKIGPGFVIREIKTGFESCWMLLSNVPCQVKPNQISQLCSRFGEVVDLKMPASPTSKRASINIPVKFSTPGDASLACAGLHQKELYGSKIGARLRFRSSGGNRAKFTDTSVCVEWEPSSKVGYAGYPTLEQANKAIEAAQMPFGMVYPKASIHTEVPAVGAVTVRFAYLPLEATLESMERFAQPEDVVWERPNYMSHNQAVNGIKRMLGEDSKLLSFEILPPPYRGRVRGWAHYSTPADAKAACERINRRKPAFTGGTPISARHIKTVWYSISQETYSSVDSSIKSFRDMLANGTEATSRRITVNVQYRSKKDTVELKLVAEDMKDLAYLKIEIEKILYGEVVQKDGKIIWDGFFNGLTGRLFFEGLSREYPMIRVEADQLKKVVRLFGPGPERAIIRERIMEKISEIQKQHVEMIQLPRHYLANFLANDLPQLQKDIGEENVELNLWTMNIQIRGNQPRTQELRETLQRANARIIAVCPDPTRPKCPVCFDQIVSPFILQCGHSWCRACLRNYLKAATDHNFFPLTCLGDDARCTAKIPVHVPRSILSPNDYTSLVDAAFAAHVNRNTDEFHYCPSPDCPQVYRSTRGVTDLQCPACLIRVCSGCNLEAHDGMACAEADGGDSLFKEWIKNNDVKRCPGCRIPIERAEGCNHMTCTQCQTHTCWVCMETFPNGEGIYGHMRSEHGNFGLGPIED